MDEPPKLELVSKTPTHEILYLNSIKKISYKPI